MVRLIDHLKSLGHSNRAARELMSTGKVWVGGAPTADAGRRVEGPEVRVLPNAPRVVVGRDPVLLHVDAAVVVAWKPAGLLSVAAPGRRDEATVVGFVARRFGAAHAVHRLDEGTSGLMLVARTEEAQEALKERLERHEVERGYKALVLGAPEVPATLRSTFVRDRGDGLRGSWEQVQRRLGEDAPAAPRDPKPAVTHLVAREEVGKGVWLVEARLETGRTHQVRIHLAEAGHPVLGDPLYGGPAARRFPRLALHAFRLAFKHPVGGAPMRFEIPLADDLERGVRVLRGEEEA